jgi:transketolase
MRQAFCKALVDSASREEFIFLTGDLGYKALEPLRDAMGARFINAGVAEQNMVSVSAALARSGLRPWCYSIAPFMYARPFEQIRNDVCLHDLPVVMVGNGGGYGYGVMGATHHALEDYGALLTLPHLRAFVPAFDGDLKLIIGRLMTGAHPAYLRLGLSEEPKGMTLPPYAPWRKLCGGRGPTIVGVGPIAGGIAAAARDIDEHRRPCVWVVTELPVEELPATFLDDLAISGHLAVVEEHAVQGGAGQMLAHQLLLSGRAPRRFTHRAARGYVSGRYGSQVFHRRESGLDAASILADLAGGPVA